MKSRLKDPTRQADLVSERPVKNQESKVSKKQRKVKVSEEKGQLCRLLEDTSMFMAKKRSLDLMTWSSHMFMEIKHFSSLLTAGDRVESEEMKSTIEYSPFKSVFTKKRREIVIMVEDEMFWFVSSF